MADEEDDVSSVSRTNSQDFTTSSSSSGSSDGDDDEYTDDLELQEQFFREAVIRLARLGHVTSDAIQRVERNRRYLESLPPPPDVASLCQSWPEAMHMSLTSLRPFHYSVASAAHASALILSLIAAEPPFKPKTAKLFCRNLSLPTNVETLCQTASSSCVKPGSLVSEVTMQHLLQKRVTPFLFETPSTDSPYSPMKPLHSNELMFPFVSKYLETTEDKKKADVDGLLWVLVTLNSTVSRVNAQLSEFVFLDSIDATTNQQLDAVQLAKHLGRCYRRLSAWHALGDRLVEGEYPSRAVAGKPEVFITRSRCEAEKAATKRRSISSEKLSPTFPVDGVEPEQQQRQEPARPLEELFFSSEDDEDAGRVEFEDDPKSVRSVLRQARLIPKPKRKRDGGGDDEVEGGGIKPSQPAAKEVETKDVTPVKPLNWESAVASPTTMLTRESTADFMKSVRFDDEGEEQQQALERKRRRVEQKKAPPTLPTESSTSGPTPSVKRADLLVDMTDPTTVLQLLHVDACRSHVASSKLMQRFREQHEALMETMKDMANTMEVSQNLHHQIDSVTPAFKTIIQEPNEILLHWLRVACCLCVAEGSSPSGPPILLQLMQSRKSASNWCLTLVRNAFDKLSVVADSVCADEEADQEKVHLVQELLDLLRRHMSQWILS